MLMPKLGAEIGFQTKDIPARKGWIIETHNLGSGDQYMARREDAQESTLLESHSFEEWDRELNFKLSALAFKALRQSPGGRMTMLDVGGGVDSRMLRTMLAKPAFAGKVHGINVDLFARDLDAAELSDQGLMAENLQVINGDIADCELPGDSVDLVTSMGVLDALPPDRQLAMLAQIARVLKPGGEATIDAYWLLRHQDLFRPWFTHPDLSDGSILQPIADQNGVVFSGSWRETSLDGRTHIFGCGHPLLTMMKVYAGDEYVPVDRGFREEDVQNVRQLYGLK
ncbi:class I SAM-dependent methyltransferase [Candidatus Peregrinibacteria bacterium]|nr:class I SAM-dependent methyltransferase [Candidatus Peregrinibacteria bacterium]